MFHCKFFPETIRRFFYVSQRLGKMCLHFFIIPVIFRKLSIAVHQSIGCHEEFQLFICRIGNTIAAHLRQICFGFINKSKDTGSNRVRFFHCFYHLHRISRHTGNDHNRFICKPGIPRRNKLRSIVHINRKFCFSPHVNLRLHGACISTPDTDPVNPVKAGVINLIYNPFNLSA